jgi:hypothetical protein
MYVLISQLYHTDRREHFMNIHTFFDRPGMQLLSQIHTNQINLNFTLWSHVGNADCNILSRKSYLSMSSVTSGYATIAYPFLAGEDDILFIGSCPLIDHTVMYASIHISSYLSHRIS